MYTMVKLCLQLSRRGFQRPISHRLAMHTKHGQFRYNERILFYKKMRREWIQVLCYKVKAHIHVQNGRYCCNKAPIDSPHLKSSLTKRRLHVHHGVTDFNEILSKLCHSENKITANARESPIPGDCGAAEGWWHRWGIACRGSEGASTWLLDLWGAGGSCCCYRWGWRWGRRRKIRWSDRSGSAGLPGAPHPSAATVRRHSSTPSRRPSSRIPWTPEKHTREFYEGFENFIENLIVSIKEKLCEEFVEHLRVGWFLRRWSPGMAMVVSSSLLDFRIRPWRPWRRETRTDIYLVPRYAECLKPLRSRIPAYRVLTTVNIAFSVTYYFGITQSFNCLLYISFYASKGEIGCLDIIEN